MSQEQPTYYAIIPASVRYNKTLKANEKLLYGEITCLTQKTGFCWATNKYFAELYDTTPATISRWISNLEAQGFVERVIQRNEKKEIIRRVLRIKTEQHDQIINTPIDEKINTPIDENDIPPIDENDKENNINNNNININIIKRNNNKFQKPSIEQLENYSKEIGYNLDSGKFYDYYESKGWMVGRTKMKDWKATVRNWKRNDKSILDEKPKAPQNPDKELNYQLQLRQMEMDSDIEFLLENYNNCSPEQWPDSWKEKIENHKRKIESIRKKIKENKNG